MGEEEEEVCQSEPNAPNPNEESEYSWPLLRFDVPPQKTYHFHRQFTTPTNPNNFLKDVKWSPDGSSFLPLLTTTLSVSSRSNLSAEGHSDILAEHPAGVYFGWAGLSGRGIFKMVMSIGWNPYFDNKEKTIEPWLLHDFTEDFYGEELRLVIVGYIRPEVNFPSLESLITKIHEDRKVAERALELPLYASYKNDSYFRSS